MEKSFGYVWADWCYGAEKDQWLADVWDACGAIDASTLASEKAVGLAHLREKIGGSRRPWVDGVRDFVDFESRRMVTGRAPLMRLGKGDDFRALEILEGAARHGAMRGLCVMPGGEEWISQLSEFCTTALYQGFKWVRGGRHLDEWELPAMGEAWCKGAALWGAVSMFTALDAAGEDSTNDAVLARSFEVFGNHLAASSLWLHYRGEHPHFWWSEAVRGRAPSEAAIRHTGAVLAWPPQMVDVLVRGAEHVNTWMSPDFPPQHFSRTRGVLIGPHTPRLWKRVQALCDELTPVGGVTEEELPEVYWRTANWLASHAVTWRGRGDESDRVQEVSVPGAVIGVQRENRDHLAPDLVDRVVEWSRPRVAHLRPDEQTLLLGKVGEMVRLRGRLSGGPEYVASTVGKLRFAEGAWNLSTHAVSLGSPFGGALLPEDCHELTIRVFNAFQISRRAEGRDVAPGDPIDGGAGCVVCVGNELFLKLVDNRPGQGVTPAGFWGTLIYLNLGLGTPDDSDIGFRSAPEWGP
ncbi:hypothetical protein ACIRU8_26610 [Streptomyces sp. NPDC101175]|uniref:hypothetical protein n=1 Tax=Streptomyces sp. NPDC101175 TaxID=3366123 RepID=UPI00383877C5